ncbi:hypothetical protein KR009_000863 [Drosophila setifemur]|nr:hypothetical protein KR009_000863 [Drosophila setifemur]
MAIAYYIPDQAQLLARSYQQNSQQASASQRTSNRTPTATPAASPQQPQQAHQQHRQQPRPQFRANISVPLGSRQGSMTMSEFGCWDLLAQIFCYALRIYSSSQRRPTVIQISFEISSGTQNNDEDDNEDVTDATSKGN